MTNYDFDLFVVGGGSAGVRASRIAATHGARVGVAEERYMGGTCVNVGCIPKKLLAYSSGFAHSFEDARGYGWKLDRPRFSWGDLIRNKDGEIERLNGVYRRLMDQVGVRIWDARASLVDAHTVEIAGHRRVSADKILIATGGWPFIPDIPGKELAISSNEAFHLAELPRRVVIVGGGYIAVEFAGIFQGMGAEVTLIHRGMTILSHFDHELGPALMHEMHAHGIKSRLPCVVERIEKTAGGLAVHCGDGAPLEVDCVLYATGRRPMTRGIGLEELGIKLDVEGAIIVDEEDRSSVPHIFAIGDVTNQLNLTPVATAKGHALADRLFAGSTRRVSLENVATAIFSAPPIATVGLSEVDARERGIAIDIYKTSFRPLKHRLSERDQQTFMKLVVRRDDGRVIGCHMIGDDAPEIMQGFAVAITAGATKAMFDQTIGIHPTSAEELVTMRTPVKS
ncbi:MAG TPA: glutathione-disulfide reductase [Alphaproteobacteria bacterium]|nr:glutathione-disulfide reductase [Alphaproteobacteria bacterium]